jgi:hypothetical protein
LLCVIKESVYGTWDRSALLNGKVADFDKIIERSTGTLNRKFKHRTVEWGLTDASLYVGGYRDELEGIVAKGIKVLAQDR